VKIIKKKIELIDNQKYISENLEKSLINEKENMEYYDELFLFDDHDIYLNDDHNYLKNNINLLKNNKIGNKK